MLRFVIKGYGIVELQRDEDAIGDVFIYHKRDESTVHAYLEAANDALDEIEAIVANNEENNLYATKTYRDMVDILIRAGRR